MHSFKSGSVVRLKIRGGLPDGHLNAAGLSYLIRSEQGKNDYYSETIASSDVAFVLHVYDRFSRDLPPGRYSKDVIAVMDCLGKIHYFYETELRHHGQETE